jgi:7-cyano-7-deazaguanine synthase
METGRKAVALLSGGLDSTTALAIASQQGFAVYALSFDYGQRAVIEIEAARHVAARSRVADHVVVRIDLGVFGGSALTGDLPMPRGRRADEIGHGIPPSYVPARNTIFLSFALAWAEVLGTGDIFIGAHILDFGGYPDCRPAYFRAYERMANLATKAGVEGSASFEIHTPLIDLSKAQIIRRGLELGVDYSLTVSCYTPSPDGEACGECDSCILRVKGFRENGLEDPVRYRKPRMTV